MISTPRSTTTRPILVATAVAVAVTAALLTPLPSQSQQPFPAPGARPQPKPAPGPAARESASAGDAGLRQRVEQLEEQLVDMQVMIGTLESLARGGVPAQGRSPSAAVSAADAGRLDAPETQISALAAQLEQLQDQVRALSSGRGTMAAPSPAAPTGDPAQRPGQPNRSGFGSLTVSPDPGQKEDAGRGYASAPLAPPGIASSPQDDGSDGEPVPKQLYEQAYGYLLQRDYGAAEAAFEGFLKRHPNDPLAGNAQYWLGETLYVRGQYRAAANAFLKGYQNYGRSAKAPESLLKLAMSLQRLGQKEAACSSYNELAAKFPNAPTHVKNTANVERQRSGC
jgi:tol-pal system protein YbgF